MRYAWFRRRRAPCDGYTVQCSHHGEIPAVKAKGEDDLGHAIRTDRLSSAFNGGQWRPILKANLGGYLLFYILVPGATFLMTYALQVLYTTIITCWAIPFLLQSFACKRVPHEL